MPVARDTHFTEELRYQADALSLAYINVGSHLSVEDSVAQVGRALGIEPGPFVSSGVSLMISVTSGVEVPPSRRRSSLSLFRSRCRSQAAPRRVGH
jgi:hypothetical protein